MTGFNALPNGLSQDGLLPNGKEVYNLFCCQGEYSFWWSSTAEGSSLTFPDAFLVAMNNVCLIQWEHISDTYAIRLVKDNYRIILTARYESLCIPHFYFSLR